MPPFLKELYMSSYNGKVYRKQGAKELVVDNGAKVTTVAGGYVLQSVATVAAAGSLQTDAAPIIAELNIVTGADGTKGVVLPVAQIGMMITVKSTQAGQTLKVWPSPGGVINAIAQDNPIVMGALTCAFFNATSATQWYTTPLLPS